MKSIAALFVAGSAALSIRLGAPEKKFAVTITTPMPDRGIEVATPLSGMRGADEFFVSACPIDASNASSELDRLHPDIRVQKVALALGDALAQSPDLAVREAIRFCSEDPSYAFEYGQALIATLKNAGHCRTALRFILAEDAEGELGETTSKWMTFLFTDWAKVSPREAVVAVDAIVPAGQRAEALQAIATVWSQEDPATFASYLRGLPANAERDLLAQATWLAVADPTSSLTARDSVSVAPLR